MTPEQRAELVRLLQDGSEISPEWARIVFPPEKREYELVYHGKEREEDVIADTLTVPLQAVRTFGVNGSVPDWHDMLIFGDNLQSMRTLLELKRSGKLCNSDGTPGVRLVYIDPPFASKQEFRGTQDQKAYQDKISGAKFVEFLRKRLILIRELLSEDGSIYVHLDQRKAHYVKVVLDEVFGEERFVNEIIWKRLSAHNDAHKYGPIHDSILLYSKSPGYVWNRQFGAVTPEYIDQFFDQVDSTTGRRYARGDLTARGIRRGETGKSWRGINPSLKGNHWKVPPAELDRLHAAGKIHWPQKDGGMPRLKRYEDELKGVQLQDLWLDIKQMHNLSIERTGYPTQKPEELLARVVRASSNEGDLILDAFAGSGTTCAVAEKLNRRWIGIDCGKLGIYTIQKRMLNLTQNIGSDGPTLKVRPFTLFNAGLYDFSMLRELPWESWRFFALQLFQCRDEPHTINGVRFDGHLKGSSVLVFKHRAAKGGERLTIDEGTVESIHSAVGRRVNRRVFIVAPAMSFDFQQDYLELDGVRYYALRIPYSIIHELHQREFTALRQPSDEMAVNDTVEAVGFDFIRPPNVEFKAGPSETSSDEGVIRITQFATQAAVRDKSADPFETFSMLLLDFDFDTRSQIFDLDAIVYADTLRAQGWQHRFPIDGVGESVMAVCTDIYGNEARILFDGAAFRASPDASKRRQRARPAARVRVASHPVRRVNKAAQRVGRK